MGLEFGIADEEEGDDDEFFLEDLIGFAAEVEELVAEPASKEERPARRCVAGRLTDYYDSEANPLFELEIGGRSVLVPAVEEFIAGIDFEGRKVRFILPEGLLEL